MTKDLITFNGIGDAAHETMWFDRKGDGFQFCKTARKPYDIAVIALLLLANRYAPEVWDIGSDGDAKDWQPTLDWVNYSGIGQFIMPKGIRL